MKSGKNLLFLPQYNILYNYSYENLCVGFEVYVMVTVVNSVIRDMLLCNLDEYAASALEYKVCKKFLGVHIYPPNYQASYPRGQYSFNSLENFYKDLRIVFETFTDIFPMHKHEFICGQFESWVLCIEPESNIITEISQYFI